MKPRPSLPLALLAGFLVFAPQAVAAAQPAAPSRAVKTRAFFEIQEKEATRRYEDSLKKAIAAARKMNAARSVAERDRARKEKLRADERAKADRVRLHAIAGAKMYPDACNKSVLEAARRQGRTDFPDWKANDQVGFMARRWKSVDSRTAQIRANKGEFGVAGLQQTPHGHVAVIVSGPGSIKGDKKFYPNVAGGASNPVARSAGEASAGDVWNGRVRGQVKYYFP